MARPQLSELLALVEKVSPQIGLRNLAADLPPCFHGFWTESRPEPGTQPTFTSFDRPDLIGLVIKETPH